MKNRTSPRSPGWIIALLLVMSVLAQAASPNPDLTAAGAIATLKTDTNSSPIYGQTYNLGATGLRGWIYLSGGAGNTHGADGTMTGESRQILVTVASAPGSAVLAVDDVILGAMAGSSGTVPLFTSDARKAFGAAIGEAEKTGAGTLRVKRWRAGVTTDENIAMTIMDDYTATAPYSCPKSTQILANARNKLVAQLLADPNFVTSGWNDAISGLALLAGVQPGDPDYATVQTRLQTYARALATAGPVDGGLPIWDWAYSGLFLAEYYLATGDANVLPGINSYTLKLAVSQSINGTFGHSASVLRPDGSGRRMGIGYGPVNAVGIVANMAIVMGKKALLAGGQAIDPEIDGAIQRGSDFFAFYVNKGPIPYGEHEPFISGHSSNGKDPMCAVLFGLQGGRAAETEYYARMTTASYRGREYGHTGQGFSYLWSAMGANMGGALAVAEHLKPVRWHLDLSRRTDGSFAYDGAEQYGGGTTSDGTYLGASGYYGLNATASYILTFALPLERLYITGKRDPLANPPDPTPVTLDAATVAHAVAAANFKVDSPGFTTAQLITSLSDYDPVVRHYAAIEVGKRTLSGADLTTLRTMVTGPDANGRMGACQALGLLQDTTALPTIVTRLDKVAETDLWVRAKAASAIRSYAAATASAHRDTMLTKFTANATNPDVIVWSDPIQMSNNFLSLALFGDAIYGGGNIRDYTVNAAKTLLYPAVQVGLKQPDSYSRSGASRFCFDKLPLADVQALIPDFFKVIEIECLADRMWSADSRANGIKTFSKYKVSEGIPYALAMLDIPEGFGWGSDTTIIAGLNALAAYGDAARWTLPTLRGYLGVWSPTSSSYTTLVSTIASIEGAITAATQVPGLAVANSQIVATTGPKVISLTGASPRSSVTFTNVTNPAHGTLTGTAPILTYTPNAGYTGPDFFTFQVTDSLGATYPSAPGTVSIIVGTAGTGLKGDYFDNMDFTNLKLTRTDAQVNFDWGTGSPNALLGADTFSVRWDGLLLVPETGTYTFSTLNSDGARLYVNGLPALDDYVDQATNWKDGASVNLTAGQMVDLQMIYYENTGSAVAKLKWTGPSFAGANGAIIAKEWLFDGTGVTNRTPYAHAQSVTLVQNTPKAITLTGSGGTLTYSIITPPSGGTLTGTAPNLTYTPVANFSGSDSFTFLVNNGTSNSNPATVSIGVWAGQPVGFTWASAASGSMSTAARWNPAAAPAAAGQPFYNLNFTPTGTYTVTHDLNSGFVFNQLNFAGVVTLIGTNTIAPAGNGPLLPQINQNSANAVTISVPVNLTTTTTLGGTGGGLMTLTGLISGPGGLTKDGPGGLRVHGYDVSASAAAPNTFSGGTIINSGTLIWGTMNGGVSPPINAALGTGPVTINPGGILQFERVDNATNPLICNGGTVFSNNGWGAKWGGPVTLNAVTTVDATWNMTFNGNIGGAGGITTKGGRVVTLSGTNSFTGPNKVTAGTLTCTKSAALGTGSLDISTGAKVALNYTGTRAIAALTYNGGTPLAPGTYGSTASPATNKNDTYFSGTGTVTVLPATTTTLALTSGSTPSNPGSSLTFTATVSGTSPSGSVAFYDGATLLGSSTLDGAFQASFTSNTLEVGSHSITAQYSGNATNGKSTSTALAIQITSQLPTAPTNLVAALGNNNTPLTWTVSAGATSYYVKRSLTNGGLYTVIGNATGASYTDLTAANGTTYYYVVSALNAAGESANSNQVSAIPGPVPSTTTLVSSPVATGPYGSTVTFTASVAGGATGTVTFKEGAAVLGTGTLSSGTATFATSTLAVGIHSITADYSGDTTFAGSVSTPSAYLVTPKSLSITGVTADGKVYDGNPTAALTGGSISGGVIGGETVTVVPGSGTFASPNAGTWAVTATGYSLGGAHAGNYTLSSQPTVPNATITPRPLQLTGTRAYDATALAPAVSLTISNKVGGDDLTLTGSASLAAKDVGPQVIQSIFATPTRVQSAKGNTGSSTSPTISVTLPSTPVSGNTLVAVISTRGTSSSRVSGIIGGGVTWSRVSQATNTSGTTTEIWYGPNVSTGTTGITISQATLRSAAIVMEYSGLLTPASIDLVANSTGNGTTVSTGTTAITNQASELWIGGIGIASSTPSLSAAISSFTVVDNAVTTSSAGNNAKVYALERMVTAAAAASSGGTIATAQWSGTIATFKAAPSLTLGGSAASNYSLTGMTGTVIITPKALAVSSLAVNPKAYDGTPVATLNGTAALLPPGAPGTGTVGDGKPYTGDAVTLGGTAAGAFADPNVGTAKAVTMTGLTLSGADSGNYTLIQPVGLSADITPRPLTVTATNQSKTYGQTVTLGSGSTQFTSSGLQNGETIESVTLACTGGGAAAAVATYPLTPSAATGGTFAAINYSISYVAGTFTVNMASTSTTVASSLNPSNVGVSVTFTAMVSGGIPAGNVAFYSGTTLLGTSALDGSFQATLSTGGLAVGSYNITAQYAGDANHAASTSTALSQTIVLPAPPANLVATPGSNTVGLTWTASVGATDYNVKRSLTNGGSYTTLGSSGGTSYTDTPATNGTTYYYVVSATNGANESSNSAQVSATPVPLPSTTTVASSLGASGAYSSTVTFTATVAVTGGPATGTVTFKDGVTVLGTGTLASGVATFATSTLAMGAHSITATYGGDTTFVTSDSSAFAYSVTAKPVTITGVTAGSKVYDGTTTATLGGAAVSGVVVGETVTVEAGTGTFASANAGNRAVTAAGYALGGADAGNYTLSAQPIVPNATITARPVQLTGARVYDGTTAAAAGILSISNNLDAGNLTLTGSVNLAGKDVGFTSTAADTSTLSLTGSAAANYTLTGATGTVQITTKALAVSLTASAKDYDGTSVATFTAPAALLTAEAAGAGTTSDGIPYTGDEVALGGTAAGTFADPNVGTAKAVTVTELTLTGTNSGNYTLTQPTGLTADINARPLTVTASNQSKTYGQTVTFGSGSTQFTSSGLQNGETIGSLTLTCSGGGEAAVAATYPITPSAATGGTFAAGNYTLQYVAGTFTVNMAPTGTSLASSLNPATVGVSVTFTATVTGGTPTGNVTFYDGATALGTSALNGSFQATLGSSSLTAGTHSISAQYAGNANYAASTATALSQVIVLPPYSAWALDPAQGLTAGVNDGPSDDPDFDGIKNQLELVLGGAPMVSSQAPLPVLTESAGVWSFAYNRSVASRPPATTQIVEYGDNLSGWTPLTIPLDSATNVLITPQGQTDRVTVTIPSLGAKGFVRLNVTQ